MSEITITITDVPKLDTFASAVRRAGVYQLVGGSCHKGDFMIVDDYRAAIYVNMLGSPPYAIYSYQPTHPVKFKLKRVNKAITIEEPDGSFRIYS